MPLTYRSGEDVRAGDRVSYHGEPGLVEFVADTENPDTAWYLEKHGDGCMIACAGFGHVYVSETHTDEDLDFIGRRGDPE
jgi:hypothetical protein